VAGWTEKGAVCPLYLVKGNTSFEALEALAATHFNARNDNCRMGRLIARRHRLGHQWKPITTSRLGLDNSRNGSELRRYHLAQLTTRPSQF
jgi:hypothetical protein